MIPDDRPYVLLNFAMSVDGKISTVRRDRLRFSSRADRDGMDELRATVDAVLVGAGTIRAEDPPVKIRSQRRRAVRLARGDSPHPASIVLTRSLHLPLTGRYYSATDVRKLVVTTEDADPLRVERVRRVADVLQFGNGQVDLPACCRFLRRHGIRRLLVEGGGEVNMAFFRHRLVDEVYMTLCPVIIGGREAPTPVDGEGFAASALPSLELLESRRVGDELFQRYRVVQAPADSGG
jgi:2,5-diamino-6-(ribosylamino)-4(3H)-pyrimidinone 5'-phosphate reductase